jgi:hypothetical protein
VERIYAALQPADDRPTVPLSEEEGVELEGLTEASWRMTMEMNGGRRVGIDGVIAGHAAMASRPASPSALRWRPPACRGPPARYSARPVRGDEASRSGRE